MGKEESLKSLSGGPAWGAGAGEDDRDGACEAGREEVEPEKILEIWGCFDGGDLRTATSRAWELACMASMKSVCWSSTGIICRFVLSGNCEKRFL